MRYGRQNQPIRVPVENMLVDVPAQTLLSADMPASSSTLSVANITGFAINQVLLIGDIGNQNSEIIKTSASTPPASGIITLASNTVFAHTANTPVTVLYYDQIEYSTALTTTGSKTVLGTLTNIVANYPTTDYNDIAASTGYYFARWKNTISSSFSDYSEPSPVTAYTMSSARSVIDSALGMINKQTSNVLTDEYAFQQIDACQMECLREFKRWSFMQNFNIIVAQAATGTWKFAVPADLDDQVTYKSIWNLRIGKEPDMIWVDKAEWDALIEGMAVSTLAVQANISDLTLTLTSSADFTDQGTIQVGANQYTWTANNTGTGVLTLNSPVTAIAAVGQDVFQYADLGLPSYWTIYQGNIYFWPICSSVYNGRNLYMDYYKALVQTTADSQTLVIPDPTVAQYYLAHKFLLKINNGEATTASDSMYQKFKDRLQTMKQKESVNRNFILSPDLGGGGFGGSGGGWGWG